MKKLTVLSLFFVCSQTVLAQSPLVKDLKWGAFLDTYYAMDFNRPKDHEREYTTQPVRSEEFNINLAHIEVALNSDKTRGRLALQYGNSVTKNYSAEPDQDVKIFQEAYIGKKSWRENLD